MNNFILIRRDGTEERQPFLIVNGVEYVSEHITREEFDQGERGEECAVFECTIELFEHLRCNIQKPIPVNSLYRGVARQTRIYREDVAANGGRPSGKVARPGSSPHHTGAAMDLAIPAGWDADRLAPVIVKISMDLGFDRARVGYVMYNKEFIHIDLVYMLYNPWIPGRRNPHPRDWAPGVTW